MLASFGSILDAALDANLEQQASLENVRRDLGLIAWLHEFASVSVSYGRRTGKTTAIARRATSKDLVFVHNWYAARDLETISLHQPKVDPVSALVIMDQRYRGLRFDRIWVDNASYVLNDENKEQLYEIAMSTQAKQVILIG